MGLLDTNLLSSVLNGAFSGIYASGVLHGSTLVDDGMGGWTETSANTPCKVQRDLADQRMMAEDGYVGTDVRLLILSQGIDTVTTDHSVTVYGERYHIMSVTRDPANSYFECRGRK